MSHLLRSAKTFFSKARTRISNDVPHKNPSSSLPDDPKAKDALLLMMQDPKPLESCHIHTPDPRTFLIYFILCGLVGLYEYKIHNKPEAAPSPKK